MVTEDKGFLLIPLDDGNRNLTDLILTKVFFAPQLKFNLISTIKLGKKSIAIYLLADGKPAQLVHKERVIRLAKPVNNQYVLQTRSSNVQAFVSTNLARATSIQIWHE